MSQWSAQAYCSQQLSTAYLIQITSQTEFDWVKAMVQPYNPTEVWVNNYIFLNLK